MENIPKATPELAKQMMDYLVELYSDQMGVEYTYEEQEKTKDGTA